MKQMFFRLWPVVGVFVTSVILAISILSETRDMVYAPLQQTPLPQEGGREEPRGVTLPSHPLYPLRMIGQRVMLWSTFGATQKAERRLAYAMERFCASGQLVESNPTLALTTLLKGHHYLLQAAEVSGETSSQKILRAVVVEEQLIEQLKTKVLDNHRSIIDRVNQELQVVKTAVREETL